jgi:hypothetical protein
MELASSTDENPKEFLFLVFSVDQKLANRIKSREADRSSGRKFEEQTVVSNQKIRLSAQKI